MSVIVLNDVEVVGEGQPVSMGVYSAEWNGGMEWSSGMPTLTEFILYPLYLPRTPMSSRIMVSQWQ